MSSLKYWYGRYPAIVSCKCILSSLDQIDQLINQSDLKSLLKSYLFLSKFCFAFSSNNSHFCIVLSNFTFSACEGQEKQFFGQCFYAKNNIVFKVFKLNIWMIMIIIYIGILLKSNNFNKYVV